MSERRIYLLLTLLFLAWFCAVTFGIPGLIDAR